MKLLELRQEKKLTQKDVAKVLGITPVGYNGYENNNRKPSIETLIKLADFYNVSLDYLCDRQWDNKAYIEVWRLTDEQKANLYLIEQLNKSNNLIVNGYLLRLLQEQKANG